ncbi:HEAT repeat domain-containing protein [Candidatus Poribacteria bacterium]
MAIINIPLTVLLKRIRKKVERTREKGGLKKRIREKEDLKTVQRYEAEGEVDKNDLPAVTSDPPDEIPNVEEFQNKTGLEGLIRSLTLKDLEVRRSAEESIRDLCSEDEQLKGILVAILGSHDKRIRSAIADLLVKMNELFMPQLIASLRDLVPEIRWRSAEILGRSKNRTAVEHLSDVAVSDIDDNVREAAVEALKHIGEEALEGSNQSSGSGSIETDNNDSA